MADISYTLWASKLLFHTPINHRSLLRISMGIMLLSQLSVGNTHRAHTRTIEIVIIFIIEVPLYHTFSTWLSFISLHLLSLLLLLICL